MKRMRGWKKTLAGWMCCVMLGGVPLMQAGTVQADIWNGEDLVEGLDRSPGYYILPDSSSKRLSADDVSGLTDTQKQMAINEIYARHGRRFRIPEVQWYFNEKAWYLGTVAADDFDVDVFSETEEKNIELLGKNLEYLLPGSNLRYLTDEEISGLTASELQLGINEIYARRGRKFSMKEYRDYFEDKSWYDGTIEPEDFDESVFNIYESSNIEKLKKAIDSPSPSEKKTIYTSFGGDYDMSTQDRECYILISQYEDVSCAEAPEGQECASIDFSIYYADGGMSFLKGYLYKKSGNEYTISGRNLEGTLTVGADRVTVSRTAEADGTYVKNTIYY